MAFTLNPNKLRDKFPEIKSQYEIDLEARHKWSMFNISWYCNWGERYWYYGSFFRSHPCKGEKMHQLSAGPFTFEWSTKGELGC